jgi:hypothetical protein
MYLCVSKAMCPMYLCVSTQKADEPNILNPINPNSES